MSPLEADRLIKKATLFVLIDKNGDHAVVKLVARDRRNVHYVVPSTGGSGIIDRTDIDQWHPL